MIVRILDDGQYEVDEATAAHLSTLDTELGSAISNGDAERFISTLAKIENEVVSKGHRLEATQIVPSDLTLPHHGASLEEVAALLASDPEKD